MDENKNTNEIKEINVNVFSDLSEFKQFLKNTTESNDPVAKKQSKCEEILQKVHIIPIPIQIDIGFELIDMLERGDDIKWCAPLFKQIVKRTSTSHHDQSLIRTADEYFKKFSKYFEQFPTFTKPQIELYLEILNCLPQKLIRNFNMVLYLSSSLLNIPLNDLTDIFKLILLLPIKNILFSTILLLQDIINAQCLSSKDIQQNETIANVVSLIYEQAEFQHSILSEFLSFFKIYIGSDQKLFEKPVLVLMYIVFYYRINEGHSYVDVLFNQQIIESEPNEINKTDTNYLIVHSMDKQINLCFEIILQIIKSLDKKHYFSLILTSLFDLGVSMLKFCDKLKKNMSLLINVKGQFLILNLFKEFHEMQHTIIDKILNEILHVDDKSTMFAELLHLCCSFSQKSFIDSIDQVNLTLHYLLSFNIDHAKMFISFIMPFIKISGSTKDSFLLLLRQNMFSKNISQQLVSITGYLMILKNFRSVRGDIDLSQCTQYAGDSYGLTQQLRAYQNSLGDNSMPNLSSEMLCIEIFEYIKRSLRLKEINRKFIYHGLKEVVSYNHQLIEPVLDILINQLQVMTSQPNEHLPKLSQSRISVENIANTVSLPNLTSCIVCCLTISHKMSNKLGKEESKREKIANELLNNLISVIINNEPSEIIGQGGDVSIILKKLYKTCQVLMEYICIGELNSQKIDNYYSLFKNYISFKTYAKKHPTADPSLLSSMDLKEDIKIKDSLVSLKFVMSQAYKLISDSSEFSVLYENELYTKYIIKSIYKIIPIYITNSQKNNYKNIDTVCSKIYSTIEFCCKMILYPTLLYSCINNEVQISKITSQIIEILALIFEKLHQNYNKIPFKVIEDLDCSFNVEDEDFDKKHLPSLVRVLFKLLYILDLSENGERFYFNKSDCTNIVKIFSIIYHSFNLIEDHVILLATSLLKLLSTERSMFDSSTVVIPLVSILFELALVTDKFSPSIISFYHDSIMYYKSSVDVEPVIHHQVVFKCINNQSVEQIFNILFSYLTNKINLSTKKISIYRNCCKVFKTLHVSICKKKSSAFYENIQGSFMDIYLLKEAENDKLKEALSQIYTILYLFSLCELPLKLVLPTAKIIQSYLMCFKNYLILQKEFLSCKKIEAVSEELASLVYKITSQITPLAYNCMNKLGDPVSMSNNSTEPKKQNNKKTKISVFKELQILPNLVFSIESFEKELATLSKISKIDLTKGCRSNTARDFKIDTTKMTAAKSSGGSN